ncbi:MAG: hypothetical protein CML17_06335 [Pusillimonas sp.]|jgi:hypothetical protein|nr:hypothetical protein [Pusillimonas sp.]
MKIWTPKEEADNLAARFVGVTRRHFAQDHKVPGGERMIYQHINAIRPISLEAAKAYARGFGCSIADISPRLALEIAGAAELSKQQPLSDQPDAARYPAWPFKSISPERYAQLTEKQKEAVEEWLDNQITSYTGKGPENKRPEVRKRRSAA